MNSCSKFDTQVITLIGDIFRYYRSEMDESAHDFGLTRCEWQVLGKLKCHGPVMTQSELNYYLGVDNAQLTRVLNELEKKGYIAKTMDAKDKRVRNLELLNPNADYLKVMNERFNKINKTILSSLTQEEQNQLIKLLKIIRDVTR